MKRKLIKCRERESSFAIFINENRRSAKKNQNVYNKFADR